MLKLWTSSILFFLELSNQAFYSMTCANISPVYLCTYFALLASGFFHVSLYQLFPILGICELPLDSIHVSTVLQETATT